MSRVALPRQETSRRLENFDCSNSATLRLRSRFSRERCSAHTVAVTAVDLGLADNLAQRLRTDTITPDCHPNAGILAVVLVAVLHDQTDSLALV